HTHIVQLLHGPSQLLQPNVSKMQQAVFAILDTLCPTTHSSCNLAPTPFTVFTAFAMPHKVVTAYAILRSTTQYLDLIFIYLSPSVLEERLLEKLTSLHLPIQKSIVKRLETVNTMFSFFWWIVGFYWIVSGGKSLPEDAPRLYWLCVAFLAFDVFFVVFCVALACVIGIAVCCCLPCIIAILYAVADQ
ncbi:hypothetical protein KI387_024611, partial [Taxus chinensis]